MEEPDLLDLDPVDEFEADEEEAGAELDGAERERRPDERSLFINHMPYPCESMASFDDRLAWTIGKLMDCIASEDFEVGIYRWNTYLQYLLALKYPLQREWRAKLAKLYYELAVMPSMDVHLTEMTGSMCITLLRYVSKLTKTQT